SAYAYYPYGTVQELSADGDADRSRWQAKEWDEEYGKYYFGSRFFDPYFGLWISPDPAGQFANPYTYGGDPVNYVDPDGEFVHIIVGAVVGAVGGAVHCGMTEANCTRSIFAGAVIGAGTAALAAPLAAAAGKAATGAVGLATKSGAAAAVAGGAASGAVSGAVSGFASSAANNAIDRGGEWWKINRSFGDDLTAGLLGGVGGGIVGGAIGGVQYGLSEAYQWQTHETVLEYAYDKSIATGDDKKLYSAIEYVKSIEGVNESTSLSFASEKAGLSNYNYKENLITIDRNDYLHDGNFSASKFYSTVVHEMQHKPLFSIKTPNQWHIMQKFEGHAYVEAINTQEKIINQQLLKHRYFNYWDNPAKMRTQELYMRYQNSSHPFYLKY
ncbi:MAG: RHS repeat-associated core domain-containing protein, partial [Fibromonadaceae bacterium]|nr:RHS repeat-associated core domain-containing protein [Fibromonadaceae bacterium]